eukprot:3994864-Prymnesium_polylepis.2
MIASSSTWLDCEPCAPSTSSALAARASRAGSEEEMWLPTIAAASTAVSPNGGERPKTSTSFTTCSTRHCPYASVKTVSSSTAETGHSAGAWWRSSRKGILEASGAVRILQKGRSVSAA